MGVLDKFESGVETALDSAAAQVFRATVEPAQIARRAEKQMKREKLVGANQQHAPTLYTVLISSHDNHRLFAYYPTMAAEIETFLLSRGSDAGLSFDGRPLVRFIVDKKLKKGRFDVIAENVSAAIIAKLREEEALYLGTRPASEQPSSVPFAVGAADAAGIAAGGGINRTAPSSDESEPARGEAWLVDHAGGRRFRLNQTRVSIGRGSQNAIVLADSNASREHALLKQNAVGVWKILDLGSTNGTLVNGQAVDQLILRDHDEITIGVTILEFRNDE